MRFLSPVKEACHKAAPTERTASATARRNPSRGARETSQPSGHAPDERDNEGAGAGDSVARDSSVSRGDEVDEGAFMKDGWWTRAQLMAKKAQTREGWLNKTSQRDYSAALAST